METIHRSWPVRRRFKRFEAKGMPATMVADTFARVIDVSVNGLAVETQSQLKIGKSYVFDLSHGNHILTVNGTIRWSKLRGARKNSIGGVEKVFHAGVVLDELSHGEESKLTRFIECYGHVTPGEKLFARLEPSAAPAPNDLSSFGVRVKKLSRAKILVESELGVEPGARCQIRLHLDGQRFQAEAEVVSLEERRAAKPEARHLITVQITDMSRGHRRALEAYISRQLERLQPHLRSGPQTERAISEQSTQQREPGSGVAASSEPLKGNSKSLIVHRPGCRGYGARDCTERFATLAGAEAAGYRPCQLCAGK